jgi:RND family efflux transporter MFP subunit
MRSIGLTIFFSLAAPLAMAQDGEPPAPKVSVAAAYSEMITDEAVFLGRGEAVDKADIVARVEGFLEEKLILDGQEVDEGQQLFRIESDRYDAELAAQHASLARAEADLRLAQVELARKEQLVARDAAPVSERDIAEANEAVAEANIESAKAAIEQAELNVSYTEITAPFPGRVGRANLSVGEIVNPGIGALITLVREKPVYVTFSLSEKQILDVLERTGGSMAELSKGGAQTPDVFVTLPNGSELSEAGKIVFIDNRIDPTTGTISLRAKFNNELGLIVDGAFVNARIQALDPTERLLVPQAAVQRDQRGEFVLVVTQQQTVEQRYIQVGPEHDTAIIVLDGLQEGEAVIIEGLQRVRPGVPVEAVVAAEGQE